MKEPVVVGIVHSSRLIRDGMRDLLSRQPGIRIAGAFGGAGEFLQQPIEEAHVLIYDVATAHDDGPSLMRELRGRFPYVKLLIFNMIGSDGSTTECVRAGASGCVEPDASLEDLVEAVRSVWQDIPAMCARCVTLLFKYVSGMRLDDDLFPSTHLSKREVEIARLIAEGLSNKEIAQRLYLQTQTVKNYVHLILQKLDVRTRLDVIRVAQAPPWSPRDSSTGA